MHFLSLSVLLLCITVASCTPCLYQSPQGVTFDLRPLTATGSQKSYYILDGDLSCTKEEEPTFSYTWNFCAPVTPASLPGACANVGKNGVALQYLESGKDSFCFIIGRYDSSHPDMRLLDESNPAKGVSIEYPTGERCDTGVMRKAFVDVECSNTETRTLQAVSDRPCTYRLTMKSQHGCPKECAMTDNGLCNNHGHCGYDYVRQTSYCFCNDGYYGDSCEDTTDPNGSGGSFYDGHSVQVWLLITLLAAAGVLVYSVVNMGKKIRIARQEAAMGYGQLPGESGHDSSFSTDMSTDSVRF
jgi:hypothetical protein